VSDTYDRRTQLGASRRRKEDADALHHAKRWSGAIYMGGYAIEYSLKALICHKEHINNLEDSKLARSGVRGNGLHNLQTLLGQLPNLERSITLDRSEKSKLAWQKIVNMWQKDELRYGDKQGNVQDSQQFLDAISTLYPLILSQQGE